MGEILDRTGRIIKRRFFPPREQIPFNPSLDQLNDARATLADLRRIGAVSDFAATGMGQIIDKATVSDSNIDVNVLRGIGSAKIQNLHDVVTKTVGGSGLEVDDRGQLEYVLDLTQRAEAQARRQRVPSVPQVRRNINTKPTEIGFSRKRRILLATGAVLLLGAGTAIAVDQAENYEPSRGETSQERAREIFGKDFLGPDAVKKAFGIDIPSGNIPKIPFPQAELERAKELDQFLILRTDRAPGGQPLTILKMTELPGPHLIAERIASIGNRLDYEDRARPYISSDISRKPGWALVSKELIPGSAKTHYLDQTNVLASYIRDEVYKGVDLPIKYQRALHEFMEQKEWLYSEFTRLKNLDKYEPLRNHQDFADRVISLKLNQLMRQTPVEAFYDALVFFENNGTFLLANTSTCTLTTIPPHGIIVTMGHSPYYLGNKSVVSLHSAMDFGYEGPGEYIGTTISRRY